MRSYLSPVKLVLFFIMRMIPCTSQVIIRQNSCLGNHRVWPCVDSSMKAYFFPSPQEEMTLRESDHETLLRVMCNTGISNYAFPSMTSHWEAHSIKKKNTCLWRQLFSLCHMISYNKYHSQYRSPIDNGSRQCLHGEGAPGWLAGSC